MECLIELTLILFLFFITSLYYYNYFHNKINLPSNWPIIGMLPALLKNIHRIHDYFTESISKTTHMTFHFKGPWFANMDTLATVNPTNIHYIMSKNFGNYPKGAKFYEIFDVLGDGIFNTDSTMWQFHRKMAQSFIGHPKFHEFLTMKIVEKVEIGLKPVLNHVSKQGIEVDLQDLLGRFTFDTICTLIMNFDPKSLSVDFPSVPPAKALDDVEEAIAYRHALPSWLWKFQRWLNVGLEKKHKQAWKVLDDFVYTCIATKRDELRKASFIKPLNEGFSMGTDLVTLYMEEDDQKKVATDKFLRDTILNFFIAGRDTTSTGLTWFFYLLSKNPHVLSKIRHELDTTMIQNTDDNSSKENNLREFYSKLVYLHAALSEALRLYPPVAFEVKSPTKPDILPSGHNIEPNMQIMISLYAMARMKDIWGDDCCEFKPERWISQQGKLRHEPSYKFLAFNAGPRTCIGKDMAFTQMKIVAMIIIQNYDIIAVEGQLVVPNVSVILHMKHGFKVKVLSRDSSGSINSSLLRTIIEDNVVGGKLR